jgi:RNA polymerase sigma factor (sigma-70 family)
MTDRATDEDARLLEQRRTARSEHQSEPLRKEERRLANLVDAQNKKVFFNSILPLLKPLKSYIKRRLRAAYFTGDIQTPVYTSGDFVDEVVLQAYEQYEKKPADLSVEEWLYRLTNERLERYLRKRKSTEKRRRSLETLNQTELHTLEQMPITADADGEVWVPEELDDSEYEKREFNPPSDSSTPEAQLEREEEVEQVVQALSHVPEQNRVVFELFAVEGFSKEAVARIANISPDEVTRIVERVKEQIRREIQNQEPQAIQQESRRAS